MFKWVFGILGLFFGNNHDITVFKKISNETYAFYIVFNLMMWVRLADLFGILLYELYLYVVRKIRKMLARRKKMRNFELKYEPSKLGS